ncbi:MAG: type II secretion system F family protein [Balneolaceae bacterium]
MPHFRFQAKTTEGKLIQREFEAPSKSDAKKKVNQAASARSLRVQALDEKRKYLYRVRKNGQPPVEGEQEAYSSDEVERALKKMGYKVDYVRRKWFDLTGRVPKEEVVMFVRLSADLLRQKLPFDQILTLLHEDTTNDAMKAVIRTIQKDLRDGKESTDVYAKHENVFGRFASYMLGIASTSGNMASVFESTAKFIERDSEFKKSIRRSLFMPSISVLAIIGTLLFFVGYIFPVMAEMFLEFDIIMPPLTAKTLVVSYWLQDNWFLTLAALLLPVIVLVFTWRNKKGRLLLDKMIIRLPVMGDLLHKISIEIFARVFQTLYSGSGRNIEVIRIAAEACRNSYIENQIKNVSVKLMLNDGVDLIHSLEASEVFPKSALSRFRLGAESGSLKVNAGQLADYYEKQTTYKLESVIGMINLIVNLLIFTALIFITIVSSEGALIQPNY